MKNDFYLAIYIMSDFVIVHCKTSYKDNKPENTVSYNSIEESLPDVLNQTTCSFEILQEVDRCIYLDIEQIEFDNKNIIYEIIEDFCNFIHVQTIIDETKTHITELEFKLGILEESDPEYLLITKELQTLQLFKNANTYKDILHLTCNEASTGHKKAGLSYHVILPIVISYLDMKRLICMFIDSHQNYSNYMDASVYSAVRLFRLPDNGKMSEAGIDMNDVHKIISGTFEHFYIQNINYKPHVRMHHLPENFSEYKIDKKKHRSFLQGISKINKLEKTIKTSIKSQSDNMNIEFFKMQSKIDQLTADNNKMLENTQKIIALNEMLFQKLMELENKKQ